MAQPFLAEVRIFAGNYAPQGWALCNGQILPIAQNQALFSLLGTTYGGNGVNNFALPNLQQRIPLHQGQGPGLTPRMLGEIGGEATHQLTLNEMAGHNHSLNGTNTPPSVGSPAGALLAAPPGATPPYHDPSSLAPMPVGSLSTTGNNTPHNNQQPYLVLNFIIALQGIFPSRN
ncbi:phage tail protein [Pseudoduganella sp. RAF19]|uniref:phage tail protein n=1 Tax=Pseudoduganella sp. RAF19 TaxID=3233052 RepID=UPI003F960F14